MNITIFEKTNHIGGRSLTVDVYDDILEPVELGASIFVKANAILYNATQEFGLGTRDPGSDADKLTVIWDGSDFVFETSTETSWWWDIIKLAWKYGLAPYRAQKLMQKTVGTFLKLYEEPYFPFRSLSTRSFELDLAKITGVTGQQFLADNGISAEFANDIVQAATRVNYASNLNSIHGLDTMVSMAPEGAMAIQGGNWRIFDHFVAASGAHIALNTSVSSITLGTKPGATYPKYLISTQSDAGETAAGVAFDNVILATPYQFSDIKAGSSVIETAIDEVPYITLHVTLFTSPLALNPSFLGLKPDAKVPTTILTTYAPTEDGSSGPEDVGKTGFFSVSTLRSITNPKTGKEEVLYKIFSPNLITPTFLSSLLGAEIPDTFTGAPTTPTDAETQTTEPISWYHPHVFHSYPKALPRVTFQDPIVGNGVYYTSGMEGFISTMETNALMGKNVARLIVDDALGLSTGHALQGESMADDEVTGSEKEAEGSSSKVEEL